MPSVSRLYDSIQGMTAGEHSGHTEPHAPSEITGDIHDSVSSNVFCNRTPVAVVGSTTNEYDSCCGMSHGSVAQGSPNVFVNSKPIARVGDSINAHNGTASITGGSNNVFSN